MYRSEVISVLYEQNLISFYINTLGPFSRALSQMLFVIVSIFKPPTVLVNDLYPVLVYADVKLTDTQK